MERHGYALDTGPSVFTAPEILADTLAAVGEKLEERLTLLPLETTYRAQFADGSHLDVHADPDAFAAEVAAPVRPGGGRRPAPLPGRPRRAVPAAAGHLHRPQPRLAAGPARAPSWSTLARRGGFGRLSRHVERYFADDRLRRLFSFQALYAGVSPFRAIAAYAVIAQLDIGAGRLAPGRRASPPSPARWPPPRPTPASPSGTARPSRSSRRRDGGSPRSGWPAASGCPRTPSSSPPTSRTRLVPGLRGPRRPVYSPSCVALHLGVRDELPGQAHHTISFGDVVARASSTS